MKWQERIKNLKLPRLLIEAALIFGSVYLALLLEADRSKDFEREILIEELEDLKRALKNDSVILLTVRDTYLEDSIRFAYFQSKPEGYQDSIFKCIIGIDVLSHFPERYLEEPLVFNQVKERAFLFQNRRLILEFDWYTFQRSYIEGQNRALMELEQKLFDYIFERYDLQSDLTENQKLEIVSLPLTSNTISEGIWFTNYLLFRMRFRQELANDLRPLIDKEIRDQEEAMEGFF